MDSKLSDNFRLFPEQASTLAPRVDALIYYVLGVSVFFTLLILALIVYFVVKYRRRSPDEFPRHDVQSMKLEITWCVIPFILMLVMFFWGTNLYAWMKRPPENAMTIYVLGKQWMWKLQHPEGVREINALHVPVGQRVKLIMGSQDVIHSFFVPAFRIKQDVVPGVFTSEWFTATKPGRYHLFCSQYCGAEHANMIGEVIAMEPAEYQAWLSGAPQDIAPAAAGQRLFSSMGCGACHGERGPTLAGLYLSKVPLDDGRTVVADENYLRESIIEPTAKIVAGYPAIMPSYRGQLSEEQIVDLVAYIKSLGAAAGPDGVRTLPSTQPANGQPPSALPDYPPARQPPEIGPDQTIRRR